MFWDYVVVGGGLSGSVVSNRLLEQDPKLKILLVEAGVDANARQDIIWPTTTNGRGGEFDWKYTSVPQSHLDGRSVPSNSGKGLGGGTLINGGIWVRGHSVDYDLWADLVGDQRWSYEGQLPYMKMTEAFFTNETDLEQHGLDGNMKIQSISSLDRPFPMRQPLIDSWATLGIEPLPRFDANAGNPIGLGEIHENRNRGRRQQSSLVYSLEGITVLTETMVAKVIVGKTAEGNLVARGVKLANGTEIFAHETILSAGSYRTPELLMLSGIGPKHTLEKHSIPVAIDHPDVGQNLHDHAVSTTIWNLKDPSVGWARGSGNPLFDDPRYDLGLNLDFIVTTSVPKEGLAAAIAEDEGTVPDPASHPLLKQDRAHISHSVQYAHASPDGSALLLMTLLLIDSARGSVTISSPDVTEPPVIDANFLGTAVDRYALREGLRQDIALLTSKNTVIGRDIVSGEGAADPLTTGSSDEEIDRRVRQATGGCFHPGGRASMGKVVDTELRVKGVLNLRVVDASVFPISISANLQVALYALSEQAARIIAATRNHC